MTTELFGYFQLKKRNISTKNMYMLRIRHFIILKSIQYICLVNVHNLRRSVVN